MAVVERLRVVLVEEEGGEGTKGGALVERPEMREASEATGASSFGPVGGDFADSDVRWALDWKEEKEEKIKGKKKDEAWKGNFFYSIPHVSPGNPVSFLMMGSLTSTPDTDTRVHFRSRFV